MSGARDREGTLARISALTMRPTEEFLAGAAENSPNPALALANFERWLAATSTPTTMYDSVVAVPEMGRALVSLFGSSHQIADVLVQNPEMASLVLDPETVLQRPTQETLEADISRMLASSVSYSHSLDRLRFIKQSWHLRIAVADLSGSWSEEDVWRSLSLVASALIGGAAKIVWKEKGDDGECPVGIVAMGKLGGGELNFSSDVDLIYLLSDDANDEQQRLAKKFAESLSRGLADRMGRGALYRVDLRLRPYGSKGELVPTMRSVESYYEKYAESWEHLAMLRSRPVCGPAELASRWNALRERTCFKPSRGDWFVKEVMEMRSRIEGLADEGDVKRGSGGIRDVEFIAQILQTLSGARTHNVGVLSTCDALRSLAGHGVLSQHEAARLVDSYTFLRQVEHRIQLLGDQQAHSVPADQESRRSLARRLGFESLPLFDSALALHRERIRHDYVSLLGGLGEDTGNEGRFAPLVRSWLDALPNSEDFYRSLKENATSLERVERVVARAPALVPLLKSSVVLSEQIVSGEVLEDTGPPTFVPKPDFATAAKRAWLRPGVLWALDEHYRYSAALTSVMDAVIVRALEGTGLRAIALGSFGSCDLLPFSDLDVILLRDETQNAEEAEKLAQGFLSEIREAREHGAPIEVDLRLRPEGKKGSLTVSQSSFEQYVATRIEPWERLALGRARAVVGEMPSFIESAAFLGRMDVESLIKIKRRVENERVPHQLRNCHIKLGAGGQDDIVWTVQLLWWRNYAELNERPAQTVQDRLLRLSETRALSEDAAGHLSSAWGAYQHCRISLALSGRNDETVPVGDPMHAQTLGRYAAGVRTALEDTLASL